MCIETCKYTSSKYVKTHKYVAYIVQMYIYIVYKYIYLDDVCLCILRHANIRHLNMYKDTQNI